MDGKIYKVDDPALLRQGVERLLKAFEPSKGYPHFRLRSWFMENAPGAVTDVTGKLREWAKHNAELFHRAHPEGGRFDVSSVPVRDYDSDEYNSENYCRTVMDGFTLEPDGTFLFDTSDYHAYYDVDLCSDNGLTLDDVVSLVERSEGLQNLYSVFSKVFKSADPSFKFEGGFGHLTRGNHYDGYPHSTILELKNTLPLDVLMPCNLGSSDSSGFTALLSVDSPNGNVFGFDIVLDLGVRYNDVRVMDPRGLLGLEGKEHAVLRSAELLDRLYGLVFSPENLAKLAPCYESKGLPLPSPSSGRHVERSRDTERRSRSRDLYRRLSEAGKEGKSLKR